MKYSDMRAMVHEQTALLDKKRLGKNQKARLATLSDQLEQLHQPPATPPSPVTGQRGDWQGNVYQQHRHLHAVTMREMRRNKRFDIRPMRSRIQRLTRRRRTGGVK